MYAYGCYCLVLLPFNKTQEVCCKEAPTTTRVMIQYSNEEKKKQNQLESGFDLWK